MNYVTRTRRDSSNRARHAFGAPAGRWTLKCVMQRQSRRYWRRFTITRPTSLSSAHAPEAAWTGYYWEASPTACSINRSAVPVVLVR
jgi:hypothetical protein